MYVFSFFPERFIAFHYNETFVQKRKPKIIIYPPVTSAACICFIKKLYIVLILNVLFLHTSKVLHFYFPKNTIV